MRTRHEVADTGDNFEFEPDVEALSGSVRFDRPASRSWVVDDSTDPSMLVKLRQRVARIHPDGVMREVEEEEGIRLAEGPWVATMTFDSDVPDRVIQFVMQADGMLDLASFDAE